jgi:hypothetical protein
MKDAAAATTVAKARRWRAFVISLAGGSIAKEF